MRAILLALALSPAAFAAGDAGWVRIPAGSYESALAYEDITGPVPVAAFELQRDPVSNADFLAFVTRSPDWRRAAAPALFAEPRYLQHWGGVLSTAPAEPRQPVVNVSWFAAQAYCESLGARLPTWSEWEYVAAADATRRDARADPAWRERILSWYSVPSNRPLPPVGAGEANAYGVRDMHGLVWEWTQDYAAMLVSSDSREQGDPDSLKFCGAGALSMSDRDNYAILMRVAMLSSLDADDVTGNLGFRCARDANDGRTRR
jgi:formylglycine-generating enzyme required for sulfatase activity